MDHLNTHSSEEVVRRVASLLDIPSDTLGDGQKRRGIPGSTQSRRGFFSAPAHRMRFVSLPGTARG